MERKLTVIFSADVQGYSRLMSDDDEATIHTLIAYRNMMTHLVEQHHGLVVDTPGDNLLAEFASAVAAVQCAVAVQRACAVRNSTLPAHRQMVFRIGINVGEVIIVGERLYGDGINIAARLEGLADAGGICIAGTVYDQVETKLALKYVALGAQRVKNIPKPVRVYRIQAAAQAVRARKRQGLPAGSMSGRALCTVAVLLCLVAAAMTLGWSGAQPARVLVRLLPVDSVPFALWDAVPTGEREHGLAVFPAGAKVTGGDLGVPPVGGPSQPLLDERARPEDTAMMQGLEWLRAASATEAAVVLIDALGKEMSRAPESRMVHVICWLQEPPETRRPGGPHPTLLCIRIWQGSP